MFAHLLHALRHRGRSSTAVLMLLSCLAVLAFAASAGASPARDTGSGSRSPGTPAERTRSEPTSDAQDVIGVKFVDGTDVRLRGGHLVSLDRGRIPALDAVLDRFPGLTIGRKFHSASEADLDAARADARARSGRAQADLNLHFTILAPGADTAALVEALNGLDIVQAAAVEPKAAPAPVTQSFVSRQGYRVAAATGGIDADFAQTLTGGKGENVTIVDVEYSWNRSHEDLSKARLTGTALSSGTPCDPFAAKDGIHSTDHGTAVLGELVGDSNTFGVTGLAPGATLRTVNAARVYSNGCGQDIANAILVAADNTSPGDVILIEQQSAGPRYKDDGSQFGMVPVEWDQTGAVWNAIQNATSRGRIVIEPAGNGYQNLDDPIYNNSAGYNWFSYDSGAIMVGAGNGYGCVYGTDPTIARGRLSFSNYGSRLNVQGWGSCVTTSGYGYLQGGTNANIWYTATFGGTSSASPIVASAAAVLSSVAESRGTTLKPATVRSLLRSTGQPQQYGNTGQIGPLPNLRAAIGALGPTLADAGHVVVDGSNLGATTVPVRQSWSVSGSAAATFEVYLSTDGGGWVKQSLASPSSSSAVFNLERNHDYAFIARAADADGVWGDWKQSTTFNLGEYQENYSTSNPALTGAWTRSPWTSASDGYLTVSATAGDKAVFSFTGTNVAWIATKSSNRGQANIYVDNVWVKTVDLYSATTTSAQFIAYSKAWATSASHTLEVRVVGTAGHPKVDVDAFVRLR